MESFKVRLLAKDEALPPNLLTGFEMLGQLDSNWCWVFEHECEVKGVLLACEMHGLAFLMRLVTAPNAPRSAALSLLRGTFRDLVGRGLKGFMTILTDNKTEYKLAKLCELAGASFIPFDGAAVVGKLEVKAKCRS